MAFAIAGLSTAATIGLVAAGAGAAASGISAIGANQRRKSRESELDAYAKQSPLYQGSKPISEYYQQAMNRYNENPYQSQQYQLGAMNARRATAQGLAALSDRRAGIGGAAKLASIQNAAMQNVVGQSEADKAQRLQELRNSTAMMGQEGTKKYDYNQLTPYNRQVGLEELKGQAAGQQYNAGMQMIGQGINSAATLASAAYKGGYGKSKAPSGLIDENGDMIGSIKSITG